MYIEDIVITIKLEHGEMQVSAPTFLTETTNPAKLKLMSELCKISDRDYGTHTIEDFRQVCNLLLHHEISLYRITGALKKRLNKFIIDISTAAPEKPKGNKRLF